MRKRDGRHVPWKKRKIEAAVRAAMEAVEESDPLFAAEVADVVELAILERGSRGADGTRPVEIVPGIEEIQDLVEKALIELGRAGVAKAYILHRDRRARIRGSLRIEPTSIGAFSNVRVRESAGMSGWSKGRIVAALMEEAELPRRTAEDVAARVERRVFASGLRRLSTGLIRELVAGELLDLGLNAARLRQSAIGLPRHDLRRILAGQPLEPWASAPNSIGSAPDSTGSAPGSAAAAGGARRSVSGAGVGARAAGEVLRRYALEDVLGEALAELVVVGDLAVEDLDQPHLPLVLALEAELLIEGQPEPRSAYELLGPAGELLRSTAHALVLEDPGTVLTPLLRATRERTPFGLGAFVRGLDAVGRAAGRRIGLGSPGRRHAQLAARLVEELAGLPSEDAPFLFLDGDELAELLEDAPELAASAERLLAAGRLVPTFGPPMSKGGRDGGERCVAPGCRRRPRERGVLACRAAAALNLPRLARRAGPFCEEAFLQGVHDIVRCAVEACRRLSAFQESHEARPAGLAVSASSAIVPVGLREALLLLGDGQIDPDLGARTLGLIDEAARRFALEGGPRAVLSPFFAARARGRFAWLDRRLGAPGLFAEAEADEAAHAERTRAYTAGFALSPVAGRRPGQPEAEVCRTVPVGALAGALTGLRIDVHRVHRSAEVGFDASAASPGPTPHLSAWRRFRALAVAATAPATGVLFPAQPPRSDPLEAPPASARPLAHESA
ncbi:MAG: ATP cone domain-containing protein [Planctomycetota bacterium]|nr:ATP cone domain-containing protein [Planctomycetota bacterium]